ncbi:hypothetical protein ACXZ65_33985 [Streptomyces aculeolatus]
MHTSRIPPALAWAAALLLLAGLGAAIATLLTGHDGPPRVALLAVVAALPLLVLAAVDHVHRADRAALAAAHYDGYVLALRHVSAGLLDQPTDDTPPHGRHYDLATLRAAEQAAGVRRLYPTQREEMTG